MAREISGKAALITGGARRIGRETAQALGRAGVNVVVHYHRSGEAAQELVGQLEAMGVRAWCVRADLRVETELAALVDRATALAGQLSILVNNASAFPNNSLESCTRDELVASIELDAWAPLELGRRFAEAAPFGAHVINMLDTRVAAQFDWQHFGYCAAKCLHAVFTQLMAARFAPRVSVNAVAPGLILPPVGRGPEYLEARKSDVPMQRVGDPTLIAETVLFLARSEFVTGQTIFVDGGRHLLGGSRG